MMKLLFTDSMGWLLAAGLCVSPAGAEPSGPQSERTLLELSASGLVLKTETSNTPPAGGGSLALSQAPEDLRWRLTSDNTWTPWCVGLGDAGSLVFGEYGLVTSDAQLHTAYQDDPSMPLSLESAPGIVLAQRAAAAADAPIFAGLHQVAADLTNTNRFVTLRVYDSASSAALWQYTSPVLVGSNEQAEVLVSDDGARVLLCVYDASTLKTRVSVFSPSSSTPTLELELSTVGAAVAYDLAADGSALALASPNRLQVVDLPSGLVSYDLFTFGSPQYGALALSGDGSRLAHGSASKFTVLERQGQGAFVELYVHNLGAPYFCRRVDLSRDGRVVVAGWHQFGIENGVRLTATELESFTTTLDTELQGGGSYSNLINTLELSADGDRFAVGLWGDEDGSLPEVMAFQSETVEPLFVDNLDGSVLALDLSPDGRRLAIAAKSVHATQWGMGGHVSLYEVGGRTISALGAPHAGATIELQKAQREGTECRFLVATSLAPAPIHDSPLGSGTLYLDPSTLVELPGVLGGPEHEAHAPYTLPSTVGEVIYVQALNVADGTLSPSWIRIRTVQ